MDPKIVTDSLYLREAKSSRRKGVREQYSA
jgi:hypothetical protein